MTISKLITSLFVGLALCFASMPAWAASWENTNEGGMNVQLYVPDTAPKLASKRALMISLHGCIQDNTDLRVYGNWRAAADEYGMVVALPGVPKGGKVAGCWDYFGRGFPSPPSHSRDNRDNDNLLDLVDGLLADMSLNIDAKQVYLTGLSSGAGETMVMSCLAPEIFAGIGINAGPTVGTGANEIGRVATDQQQAADTCERLAGNHQSAFASQLTSVIYGSIDFTVDQDYNTLDAKVMAALYDVSDKSSFSVDELAGHNPRGTGELWSDSKGPRISLIESAGLGHAWPAGSGPGGAIEFVAREGVNYPAYVTEFFFANNRRVEKNKHPTVAANAAVDGVKATITGVASDEDGSVADLTIAVTGLLNDFSEGPTDVAVSADGRFALASDALPDDNAYEAIVSAIDDQGASSQVTISFDVGHPPHPPVVASRSVLTSGDCVNVHGTATDVDDDLERVEVSLDSAAPKQAAINEDAWALADVCGLKVGQHTVVVSAFDVGGHASEPVEERFNISPPYEEVAATLSGHVGDQRVRFYPGSGFGALDISYFDLLEQHGVAEDFILYGYEDQWYADPNNLLNSAFNEIRIRSMLAKELRQATTRGSFASMEQAAPRALAQTRGGNVAPGKMERLTTEQLIEMLLGAGLTISVEAESKDTK